MNADIFTYLREVIPAAVGSMSDTAFGFFPNAVLWLGIPTLVCSFAFARGSRSVPLQVILCAGGLLLALTIPPPSFEHASPLAKVWVLVICAGLLAFLPRALARLLSPTHGVQMTIQWALYGALFLSFLFNCSFMGR